MINKKVNIIIKIINSIKFINSIKSMENNLCLPPEIWDIIYKILHNQNLRDVNNELLQNCARKYTCRYNRELKRKIHGEITLHKSIHPVFTNTEFWKRRGYCSVKCGSLNWPHSCDFCPICNADKEFCSCISR